MNLASRILVVALLASYVGPRSASAVTLTPILSPAGFLSASTFTNDFESTIDTPQMTFDASAARDLAGLWAGGVTPSGEYGLVEASGNEPLRVTFTTPVSEVGVFFGNDDFGRQFNVFLELFDAGNASLGSVQAVSNGNDLADQYLGVRSDVAAKAAEIRYQRPDAGILSVYIDDLKIGLGVVPEPSAGLLLLLGTASLAAARRRG